MLNFHRAAALLLPSVPRRLARLVDAAAQTPVPTSQGEGSVGAGQVSVSPFQVHETDNPESAVPAHPAALSGPPVVETDLFWEPAPESRWEFAPGRLGGLLDRWSKESQS